jgi:hypothetical protein
MDDPTRFRATLDTPAGPAPVQLWLRTTRPPFGEAGTQGWAAFVSGVISIVLTAVVGVVTVVHGVGWLLAGRTLTFDLSWELLWDLYGLAWQNPTAVAVALAGVAALEWALRQAGDLVGPVFRADLVPLTDEGEVSS